MDPGSDGELARRVSHDLAAWCAKPRHRATRERRGAHAIKFESRRQRLHRRLGARYEGITVPHDAVTIEHDRIDRLVQLSAQSVRGGDQELGHGAHGREGTGAPGVGDVLTPSNSNRARRRTKLEVHGDARTRPASERLQKRKETPSRTVLGPLLSLFKAPSGVRARDGRELSDTESRFREVHALCEALRTSLGSRCVQGMGNKQVSWIQDLKSMANGGECRIST